MRTIIVLTVVMMMVILLTPEAQERMTAIVRVPTTTATATLAPTETMIPTATATETMVPTATATETMIPTATATETVVPTDTPVPTETIPPTKTRVPTETPVPTATVDRISACKKELAPFIQKATQMRKDAGVLANVMAYYVQEIYLPGTSEGAVNEVFAGLNGMRVPTCADQPTEIAYYLKLMRDTMIPAFVEMRVEIAFGSPSAASRRVVYDWVVEVVEFDKEIGRLLAQMP